MRNLLVSLVIFLSPGTAAAEFRAVNHPQGSILEVMSGPGPSYSVIERLRNGSSVEVLASQDGWIKVVYGVGDTGWVQESFTLDQNSFLRDHVANYQIDALARLGRFCWQPYLDAAFEEAAGQDACLGTFYCGDGGCDPVMIEVLVRADKVDDFVALSDELEHTEIHECEHNYLVGHSEVGGKSFCVASVPGFEIENTLRLRGHRDIVLGARRTGGDAGAPPRMVLISPAQFERYRGPGIAELRSDLIDALEAAIGGRCTTDAFRTCAVMPSGGRLAINLLTPGTPITGRTDHWERSYWEVHVHWDGSPDHYLLYFDLPVTAIRRWPTSGPKPSTGFTSVDFDEQFENLRTFVMERVAYSVEAEPEQEEFPVEADWQ